MHNTQRLVIAIDGHSACGKSTLAKDVAQHLGVLYIDSGAMYRAVSFYFLKHDIDYHHHPQLPEILDRINVQFVLENGIQKAFLNGELVEDIIRTSAVSGIVSEVAAISSVRRYLVRQQRNYAKSGSLVMDGRDIGTVVFPNATLKIFLTAGIEVRIERRFLEEEKKGMKPNRQQIRQNLMTRDQIDSTREDSPLKVAEDAIVIDNSLLSRKEQLDLVLILLQNRTETN